MIKSLHIGNFQSHKDSHLDLSPGVNVIVGKSDCGKSAILRALFWLINNRPSGDALRSYWGGDTVVALGLAEDDFEVRRTKAKNANSYAYGCLGVMDELKAVGQDVPEAIKNILNILPINFQRQLDSPFLLAAGPGDVAKYLNEVVQLDVIDASMSYLNSCARTANQDLKSQKELLGGFEEQLKAFAAVPTIDDKVSALEGKSAEVNILRSRESAITTTLYRLNELSAATAQHAQTIKARKSVEKVVALQVKQATSHNDLASIERSLAELQGIASKLAKAGEYTGAETRIKKLMKACDAADKAEYGVETLEDLIGAVDLASKRIKKASEKVKELRSKLPEQCPFCNRPMEELYG